MGYSTASFEHMFSVLTYPAPGLSSPDASQSDEACQLASMPFALGPRWLAHAANQGMQAAAGCVEAQALSQRGASAAVRPMPAPGKAAWLSLTVSALEEQTAIFRV